MAHSTPQHLNSRGQGGWKGSTEASHTRGGGGRLTALLPPAPELRPCWTGAANLPPPPHPTLPRQLGLPPPPACLGEQGDVHAEGDGVGLPAHAAVAAGVEQHHLLTKQAAWVLS